MSESISQESKSTTNAVGLSRADYKGALSTLCMGCGHDSITNHIVTALYQLSVAPHEIVKLSGIGCSSKTTAYFLSPSHGFNSIHGRMAAVATGVHLANKSLKIIGISGDGDTASIGLGGFIHLIRRNVPMLYIIENNGVYGLTKGQFSATADEGSLSKAREKNPFATIDLCSLAIEMGCGFVARSFSGDSKQLVPLIQAGLKFPGTAVLDVISPCVTFANHEGSTKSYDYVKEHQVRLQELDFVAPKGESKVDYEEGKSTTVKLADGSQLNLRKLLATELDLKNRDAALKELRASRSKHEILTGLFIFSPDESSPLQETESLTATPLVNLDEPSSRLNQSDLDKIQRRFR